MLIVTLIAITNTYSHYDKPGNPPIGVTVRWDSVKFFPNNPPLNDPSTPIYEGDSEVMIFHAATQTPFHPGSREYRAVSYNDDFDATANKNTWTPDTAIFSKNRGLFYNHNECTPMTWGSVSFQVVERDNSKTNSIIGGATTCVGLVTAFASASIGFPIAIIGVITWSISLNGDDDYGTAMSLFTKPGTYTIKTTGGADGSADITYIVGNNDIRVMLDEPIDPCSTGVEKETKVSLGDKELLKENFALWRSSVELISEMPNDKEQTNSKKELQEDQRTLIKLQLDVADVAISWVVEQISDLPEFHEAAGVLMSAKEKSHDVLKLPLSNNAVSETIKALDIYEVSAEIAIDALIKRDNQ